MSESSLSQNATAFSIAMLLAKTTVNSEIVKREAVETEAVRTVVKIEGKKTCPHSEEDISTQENNSGHLINSQRIHASNNFTITALIGNTPLCKCVKTTTPSCDTSLPSSLHQLAACCDFARLIEKKHTDTPSLTYPILNPYFDSTFLHQPREIQVALQQTELWWKFHAVGTEMVITRTGRRMFPTLTMSVVGMEPRKLYSVHLDIVPTDAFSYTFMNNMWQITGIASESSSQTIHNAGPTFQADSSAHTGLYWMKNGVDFKKVRLTNRRSGGTREGEFRLSPMRKYQPRIHIIEETQEGVKNACSTFVLPETSFVAVTTYQNEEIIQMKIDHNPFAKGFRDNGGRRRSLYWMRKLDNYSDPQDSGSPYESINSYQKY